MSLRKPFAKAIISYYSKESGLERPNAGSDTGGAGR